MSKQCTITSLLSSKNLTKKQLLEKVTGVNEKENIVYLNNGNIGLTTLGTKKVSAYLKENNCQITLSTSLRRKLVLSKIIIESDTLNLINLAETVFVSKNTILNDLNSIREFLSTKRLTVQYKRSSGYKVAGKELDIRKALVETLKDILSYPVGSFFIVKYLDLSKKEITFLGKRLELLEDRLDILFTDESVDALPYLIYAIIVRARNTDKNFDFPDEIKDIKNTQEYNKTISLFWNYSDLTENDLLYLVLLVLSFNLVDSNYHFYNLDDLISKVDLFVERIEKRLAVTFDNKRRLKSNLLQHLRPALYRAYLGIKIGNPLTNQFFNEYEYFYLAVKEEMEIFKELVRNDFSPDEISFVAMILLSSLTGQSDELRDKPFTGIVVCKNGTSISKMLVDKLQKMFPLIYVKRTYSVRQYEQKNINVDFVFSTLKLNSDKNVFVVSPTMTVDDKERLENNVNQYIDTENDLKAKYIYHYIQDYLKEKDRKEIINQISRIFDKKDETESVNCIDQLVNSEEQITFVEERLDWSTFLPRVFREVLQRNSIEQNYIDYCEDSFYQSYETMIIGSGVLLPHAKADESVNKMDCQIHILSEPLISPNDEVYEVVIALAPDINNQHVNYLMKLNEGFISQQLKEKLLNSRFKSEALSFIKEVVD